MCDNHQHVDIVALFRQNETSVFPLMSSCTTSWFFSFFSTMFQSSLVSFWNLDFLSSFFNLFMSAIPREHEKSPFQHISRNWIPINFCQMHFRLNDKMRLGERLSSFPNNHYKQQQLVGSSAIFPLKLCDNYVLRTQKLLYEIPELC